MRHVAVVEDSRLPTRELLTDADTYQYGDLEVESICESLLWILANSSPSRERL